MLKPTTKPIQFTLEIERPDDATCTVRVLDPNAPPSEALVYEASIATDCLTTSQKRALKDTARHLHWFLHPI